MREILDLAFRQNFDETWMLLRTSPIRRLSDSLVTDGSEMIRCEGRRDFSMAMID
jgi:hypothetical protein